jgi:aminoglycoside 6'-N-acetyltransferase
VELRGGRVVLRPVVPSDVDELCRILATPEVARWWPTYDRARVERDYITAPDADETAYTIWVDGRIVGLIQSYEETEPEFRHASIDLFLDPDSQGHGLGPDAIRVLARHLIDDDGHHRLTIDPAAANEHAIRAYEKVGFLPVGILRGYQAFPDGTWQDGLLMDLLADELGD